MIELSSLSSVPFSDIGFANVTNPLEFIYTFMYEKVTEWLILAEIFVGNGNCY